MNTRLWIWATIVVALILMANLGGIMAIELVVFATIFTLIVLLTGGPSNWL
jgi:hypothetical protein